MRARLPFRKNTRENLLRCFKEERALELQITSIHDSAFRRTWRFAGLALNAGRCSCSDRADLGQAGHGCISGKSRQQGPVRPAKFKRLLGWLAGQQAVKQASGESVPAADTIVHIEFADRSDVMLAIDPGHSTPGVAVRGVQIGRASCRERV